MTQRYSWTKSGMVKDEAGSWALQSETEQLRQERHALQNDLTAARLENERLRAAVRLILPLARGYSPPGQSETARATCQSWVLAAEDALDETADEPRASQPSAFEQASPRAYVEGAHTPEDDFRHFLSYSKLSEELPYQIDRLRRAYYAGADAPPIESGAPRREAGDRAGPRVSRHAEKSAIVQGADFVFAPESSDAVGRALYMKEGGREWNELTQLQRAEWTKHARKSSPAPSPFTCDECGAALKCGPTEWEYECGHGPAPKSGASPACDWEQAQREFEDGIGPISPSGEKP